jgi:hypothetical protein
VSESSSEIPLAEILEAANGLVEAKIIKDYALGGALAAIVYTEPFTTYDADIFFIPVGKGLDVGIPKIYARLKKLGWKEKDEHILCKGFPVQFLAARGLTEEAVQRATRIKFAGVSAKTFSAEHIVAIAASVGRHKDLDRIEKLSKQTKLDRRRLNAILKRYGLTLPKP